jgi:hypothetical protein
MQYTTLAIEKARWYARFLRVVFWGSVVFVILVSWFGCTSFEQKVDEFKTHGPQFQSTTKDVVREVLGKPRDVEVFLRQELGFYEEPGVTRRWTTWWYGRDHWYQFRGSYLRRWNLDGVGRHAALFTGM